MAKKEFKPGDVTAGNKLTFVADIDYDLPIFDPANRIPQDSTGGSVFPLLEQLEAYLADGDYMQAAGLLQSQTRVWSGQAYGQAPELLAQMQQQAAAYYRKKGFRYRPPEADTIRLVSGEAVVLVYSGMQDNGFFKSRMLGEFEVAGGDTKPVPAMKMVHLDGKWQVWE